MGCCDGAGDGGVVVGCCDGVRDGRGVGCGVGAMTGDAVGLPGFTEGAGVGEGEGFGIGADDDAGPRRFTSARIEVRGHHAGLLPGDGKIYKTIIVDVGEVAAVGAF